MQFLLSFVLDFLFPPTEEAFLLRSLSPEELFSRLPKAAPAPFPFITSLFSYKDPLVKELVLAIKNKKDGHAVKCAAYALQKHISSEAVLLPIPVSKKRRRERGFNQCELLIEEVCALDPKVEKRFDVLTRTKDGGEQKLKDRAERLETKNIFTAQFTPLDKPIILIDDVTTTGSTLNEARETLLCAGYSRVTALTIAH